MQVTPIMPTDPPEEHREPRWLVGLRRAQVTGTVLDRWIEDHGLTGIVWTPGEMVPDDTAAAVARLVADGASPDATLLWDLALPDIREAAKSLRHVYEAAEGRDGLVAVWMDPESLTSPDRAVAAAAEIRADARRENVCVAFAWSGSRAGAASAIVAEGIPLAVGSVDRDDLEAVRVAREKGLERLRAALARAGEDDDEEPDDEADVPVFVLGPHAAADPQGLVGRDLVNEIGLLAPGRGSPPRLPAVPADEQAQRARALDRLSARSREPVRDDAIDPEEFELETLARCRGLDRDDFGERIWSRDHTLWREDPEEIADRLGWLDVAETMRGRASEIEDLAHRVRSEGVDHVVLLGMGGSSLAPEMFRATLGGGPRLTVLDTTDPDHLETTLEAVDPGRTVVVVASKSGTTVETRAALELFWSRMPEGRRYVAITDPGTPLGELARERGFREVFENPPDIGGRYSALSLFGLVPAALCGIGVTALCDAAIEMMRRNAASVPPLDAPALRLGAAIADAASEGRDKLTLVFPPPVRALGDWVEQLVAESTGKDGTGVLPVAGEDLGPPEVYRDDRIFVAYALAESAFPDALDALEEAGHPVVRIRVPGPQAVAAECFRWEFAVAAVGYVLDVHPFDQPDVESSKARTRELLEGSGASAPDRGSAEDLLASLDADPEALEGDASEPYVAIQAFLPPTEANARRLQVARMRLRDGYRVATTVGFGPRFLHSTGQLHKGGLPGVYLQVTGEHATDLDVPGMPYSFGRLIDAQADGDLAALQDAGRRAARVTLDDLERLAEAAPPPPAAEPSVHSGDHEEEPG